MQMMEKGSLCVGKGPKTNLLSGPNKMNDVRNLNRKRDGCERIDGCLILVVYVCNNL